MITLITFLNRKREVEENSHLRIELGPYRMFLNSRGRIPVILQITHQEKDEVFDLVYMNLEALKLSLRTREVYVYRRSKKMVEKLTSQPGKGYFIDSIKICKNGRSLLMTVRADQFSSENQAFRDEIDWEKLASS